MRDMRKAIEDRKHKIPERYNLTLNELETLADEAEKGQPCMAVADAFIFGYEMACRAMMSQNVTELEHFGSRNV